MCIKSSRAWRHSDLTHVPLVTKLLSTIYEIQKDDFDLNTVFFFDFRWCEGSGASFHCLRMRSRSTRKRAHMNAGDLGSILAVCAGQKHRAKLRMRPTTTQLGVFLWIRMFFTACQTSARWLVERGQVNKLMTYRMLMSHLTLKHNTPIAFLALWLVTIWSSPVYYS